MMLRTIVLTIEGSFFTNAEGRISTAHYFINVCIINPNAV
jgi:hypothetical protein